MLSLSIINAGFSSCLAFWNSQFCIVLLRRVPDSLLALFLFSEIAKHRKVLLVSLTLTFAGWFLIKRQWLCVWKEGTQFCLYTCSQKYHFLSLLLWQEYPHPRLGNRQSLFCFLGSEQPCFSIHLQSSFLIIPNPAQTFWIVVASLDSIKILKRENSFKYIQYWVFSLKTLFCNEVHSSLNLILGSSPYKAYSNLELYFQNSTRILISNICCLET